MDKIATLTQYVPAAAAPIIAKWIDYFQCEFKIARNRGSKLGDYRPPFRGRGHRISVNYDLNPYAFLVTTVHEFAHLITWNEYERKAKPHGVEWKANFKRMMKPFFEAHIFPEDIQRAILSYLQNPAASSCADVTLFKALKKYDAPNRHTITIESLPSNSLFSYKDQRIFRKDTLIRKRYRCTELKTGLVYLFSPMAEVKLVADDEAKQKT